MNENWSFLDFNSPKLVSPHPPPKVCIQAHMDSLLFHSLSNIPLGTNWRLQCVEGYEICNDFWGLKVPIDTNRHVHNLDLIAEIQCVLMRTRWQPGHWHCVALVWTCWSVAINMFKIGPTSSELMFTCKDTFVQNRVWMKLIPVDPNLFFPEGVLTTTYQISALP